MLLALDTAQFACSAAVFDTDGQPIGHTYEDMTRGHAERLVPMIDVMMASAGLQKSDLTRIVTTIGPGTFTGLRIGLAVARGYGVALGIPVLGLSTLHAIALSALHKKHLKAPIVSVIDAHRDEVYVQTFSPIGVPTSEPYLTTVAEFVKAVKQVKWQNQAWALTGTGLALIRDLLPSSQDTGVQTPDAQFLGKTAWALQPPTKPPEALYLRAPDAKLPGGIIPTGFDLTSRT